MRAPEASPALGERREGCPASPRAALGPVDRPAWLAEAASASGCSPRAGNGCRLPAPALGNPVPGARCRALWWAEGMALPAAACAQAASGGRLEGAPRHGLPLSGAAAAESVWRRGCPGPPAALAVGRRAPPLCLRGQRGVNLSATAWWWRPFRSRLRLAAGRRHYSGRHFCWSPPPGS